MLLRMRLFLSSIVGTFVLLLMLCLGSHNLSERSVVNIGIGKTVPLPPGFVVGLAILCGVFSGGTSAALLAPHQDE